MWQKWCRVVILDHRYFFEKLYFPCIIGIGITDGQYRFRGDNEWNCGNGQAMACG